MKTTAALMAALALALSAHGGHPPTIPPGHATAHDYASLVVRNDTGATVAYSIRWNRGTTVNYRLAPGGMRIHAVSAPGHQEAVVGWDSNPITGKVNRVAQVFRPGRVKDRHQGMALRFQMIDNGHRIWLAH